MIFHLNNPNADFPFILTAFPILPLKDGLILPLILMGGDLN